MKKGYGKGDPNIGNRRRNLKDQHIQDVYDAVHAWDRKIKLPDIWKRLDGQTRDKNRKVQEHAHTMHEDGCSDEEIKEYVRSNKKKTIAPRTIQRCIERDSRISREGWYYFIDNVTRFEKRYLSPDTFGEVLFQELFDWWSTPLLEGKYKGMSEIELLESLESTIKEMINRFGLLVMFAFIEATKPFKDKSMSLHDRNDLVRYWAKNAVDLEYMLGVFQSTLRDFEMAFDRVAGRPSDRSRAPNEMKESMIRKAYTIIERNYPEMYSRLTLATRRSGVKQSDRNGLACTKS